MNRWWNRLEEQHYWFELTGRLDLGEIAIEAADKEKYLKDIDHIVKTGERLKLH